MIGVTGKMWNGSSHGPAAGADLSHGLSLLKAVSEGRKSWLNRCLINKCLPSECATSAAHLPPCTAKNFTCLTNQFSSLVSKSIQLSPIEVLSMKILCTKKDFYCAILKPKFEGHAMLYSPVIFLTSEALSLHDIWLNLFTAHNNDMLYIKMQNRLVVKYVILSCELHGLFFPSLFSSSSISVIREAFWQASQPHWVWEVSMSNLITALH